MKIKVTGQKKLRVVGREDLPKAINGLNYDPPAEPTTPGNFYVYGPNGEITQEKDQFGNLVKDFTKRKSTVSVGSSETITKEQFESPIGNQQTPTTNTDPFKVSSPTTPIQLAPGAQGGFNFTYPGSQDITGNSTNSYTSKASDVFGQPDPYINQGVINSIAAGIKNKQDRRFITDKTHIGDTQVNDSKGNRLGEYKNEVYIPDPVKPATKKTPRKYKEYNSAVPSLITAGMAMTNDLLQNTLNYNDDVEYAKKVGQTNASEPTVKNVYSRGRNVMNVPLGADYAPNMMTPVQFQGRPVSEFQGFPGYGRNIAASKNGGLTQFPDGGEPCYDAEGNIIPCDKKRLKELGSDAYSAMQPFYETLYGAANKYKNERTGDVSDFNSARATAKAFIKHPNVLFMKRHRLPSEQTDMDHNPYGVQSYTTPIAGGWFPTQWAEPRKERTTGGGWENFKMRLRERAEERRGRRNRSSQGCWGANCTEAEMQDQARHGGLFKAAEGTAFTESLGLPTLVENPNDYLRNDIPDMKGPELPTYERPQAQSTQSSNASTAPMEGEGFSEAAGGLVMPLKNIKITSGFGHRKAPKVPHGRGSSEHNGVDLWATVNTPVYSPLDGVVEKIYYGDAGGKQLIIRHTDGSKSGFAHLNGYEVSIGDKVSRGQRIALSGNTGNSSGAHLHFTYRNSNGDLVDPADFFHMGAKNKPMKGVSNLDHNNPGNIHIGGFAQGYGATAGRNDAGGKVAIFPNMQTGMKAMEDLIFGSAYNNLTISEARNKWVNGSPSVTTTSTNPIVSAMGGNYRLNQLSGPQRKKLMSEFIKWEDRNVYNNLRTKGLIFKEGGEYELEDDEINYILANGGQVEYL